MTPEQLELAAHTGWVELDGTVYAAPLPDGPPVVLAGAGAAIWLSLVEGGTLHEVTLRVAEGVGSPVEVVAADVAAFVDGLVEAGLVTRTACPASRMPAHD